MTAAAPVISPAAMTRILLAALSLSLAAPVASQTVAPPPAPVPAYFTQLRDGALRDDSLLIADGVPAAGLSQDGTIIATFSTRSTIRSTRSIPKRFAGT